MSVEPFAWRAIGDCNRTLFFGGIEILYLAKAAQLLWAFATFQVSGAWAATLHLPVSGNLHPLGH